MKHKLTSKETTFIFKGIFLKINVFVLNAITSLNSETKLFSKTHLYKNILHISIAYTLVWLQVNTVKFRCSF
jgi:hypothetical protein